MITKNKIRISAALDYIVTGIVLGILVYFISPIDWIIIPLCGLITGINAGRDVARFESATPNILFAGFLFCLNVLFGGLLIRGFILVHNMEGTGKSEVSFLEVFFLVILSFLLILSVEKFYWSRKRERLCGDEQGIVG